MFRDILIYPSHYRRTAIIAWLIDPAIAAAEFYVYRKMDGGAEWELLTETPVYGVTYADTTFHIPNKEQIPAYKVLALLDGKEYESPEVTLFSRIERKVYGVSHNIIRAKHAQARIDGLPVLYYPLVRNGAMSASLDEVTGQRIKAPCPTGSAGAGGEDDYGTYYAQGYYRPFLTYIRMMDAKLVRQTRMDDGLFDENIQKTEFLSYPPVRTNDMIVDVTTDRRWFVGEGVQADLVKGIVPVSYNAAIALQAHSHPCYAVPIPENYHEMLKQLYWNQP